MTQIQLPPAALRLLDLLARGDATRSEIAALELPKQPRVLTQLLANRLIEWTSHHVCAITAAGYKCLERGGAV